MPGFNDSLKLSDKHDKTRNYPVMLASLGYADAEKWSFEYRRKDLGNNEYISMEIS